jgi:hypothetical protein
MKFHSMSQSAILSAQKKKLFEKFYSRAAELLIIFGDAAAPC